MSVVFTYNGITIDNIDLKTVNTVPVYDSGDMMIMYTRTAMTMVGTLSYPGSGDDLATQIEDTRIALMRSQQRMIFSIGGTTIYDNGSGSLRDAAGGPKPRRVQIQEIIGSSFCHILYEIEFAKVECVGTPKAIIGHRYSVTHSLDERFYTTRTTRGTLTFRDGLSNTAVLPDAQRERVTPPLPKGYKRSRATFAIAESGLVLDYEIEDVEVFLVAPKPAVTARGTFSHQIDTSGGNWFNFCSIELEGHRLTDRVKMFEAGMKVIRSKLDFSTEIIMKATMEEQLYENKLRLQFMTRIGRDNLRRSGNFVHPIKTPLFKAIPGSESGLAEDQLPYGTAALRSIRQSFLNPCGDDPDKTNDEKSGGNNVTGPKPTTVVVKDGKITNPSDDNLSQEHKNSAYVSFEENISTSYDNGVVVLPSSKRGEAGKVYQLHNPFGLVVQEGFAVRYGKLPTLPDIRHRSDTVLRYRSVKPGTPKLAADKVTFIFSVNWRYELLIPMSAADWVGDEIQTVNEDKMVIAIPRNAMVADGKGQPAAFTPEDQRG